MNLKCILLHGFLPSRLDKTPGAIAMRLRWYGGGDPKLVFVERKTHRESWRGEESVKERFTLAEVDVLPWLRGQFDRDAEIQKMKAKGKNEQAIREWTTLYDEVSDVLKSKLLVPWLRTQYMRVAFQIPFDATVRVSLDTNLCMIMEDLGGNENRWFRESDQPVPHNEITWFPHAVLEVKLSLEEGEEQPQWVTDLIDSGMLTEVHKFSKFIHGCATLFPDDVQAVPYWTDDESIRDSILQSGGGVIKQRNKNAGLYADVLGTGIKKKEVSVLSKKIDGDEKIPSPLNLPPKAAQLNSNYQTMLQARPDYHAISIEDKQSCANMLCCPLSICGDSADRKMTMKIEPKVRRFFYSHTVCTLSSKLSVVF